MKHSPALNFRLYFVLFLAFLLTIIPLPEMFMNLRPLWVLMCVLYIQFFLPSYFSIVLVFFLGLCLDVLLSTVIGEHVFALILTIWFAGTRARLFEFFSFIQQTVFITLLCFIYQLVIFLIDAFLGYRAGWELIILTPLLSLFFWPLIYLLMDNFFKMERA